MAATPKTLADITKVTTINEADAFCVSEANGALKKITLANLRNAILQGRNLDMSSDGVFILYFDDTQGDVPLQATLQQWPALQRQGRTAIGVQLYSGDRNIVIAPTESSKMTWSTASVDCGTTKITDRQQVFADFNGRANTTAMLKKAECQPADKAAGFCNAYSRTNKNGKGILAGQWWLPSIGELACIYANMQKVNYALSLINGATQMKQYYWSSTEADAVNAWCLSFGNGYFNRWGEKGKFQIYVRAVSAFL